VRAEVRRNAFLLAGSLVCNSGAFQLAAALSSLTLVAVTGVKGILGLGPAIFLVAGGIAVGPAGRLMDRTGRMPVIRGGFVLGAVGCGTIAGGCAAESAFLVCLGLALVGAAASIVLLARAAAAEMFPPAHRARGMSFVLFGAVSGAIWGPLVFGPLFANRTIDAAGLVGPWLLGIPFCSAWASVGTFRTSLPRPSSSRSRRLPSGDASSASRTCARASSRPPPRPPGRRRLRRGGRDSPGAHSGCAGSHSGPVARGQAETRPAGCRRLEGLAEQWLCRTAALDAALLRPRSPR
jgi:MFS family permease